MNTVRYQRRNNSLINLSPTRLIVGSFLGVIIVGSVLLCLPFASADNRSIGWLDALFTATSATCVTGLVVADTATQWSLFGQIVIISLIQVGGLSVITLATFFSVLLGRKISLRQRVLAQESTCDFSFDDVLHLVKRLVKLTLIVELCGAILLATSYVPLYGARGLYMSVFHGISAFCNAGFDLIGGYRSLTGFNADPVMIYTTCLLIIIGGLGFIVWDDLLLYSRNRSLYLNTKIVLIVTGSLIVGGALFFFASEYTNPATLGALSFPEKINAAVFQSVTSRTCGFNSIDQGSMHEISKLATVFLMFVGAAPGSTGGGIKVTTFGILLVAVISHIQGKQETVVLRRRVAENIVSRALSIAVLSMTLIFVGTLILATIETRPLIDVVYEVTSAFGTVGLTTGMTPHLSPISKLMLVFTMFLGRVGPLSFALVLAMRSKQKHVATVYPEGKIMVG